MKPALYYAVIGGTDPRIVAVTSERGEGHRRRWNGRYVSDNTPTHGTFEGIGHGFSAIKGRFTTVEEAQARVGDLKRIAAKYDRLREPHSEAISRLYREERAEIEKLTNVQ